MAAADGLIVVLLTGAVLLFLRVHHVARIKGLFRGRGE
jgi:hypothetical protein